jgi:hypothetical protein
LALQWIVSAQRGSEDGAKEGAREEGRRAQDLPSGANCPCRLLPLLDKHLHLRLLVQRRRGEAAAGRQRELLCLDPEDDVGPRRLSPAACKINPRGEARAQ